MSSDLELSNVFFQIGMGMGGLLGGYVSERLGWRWAFLIQTPLFLLSFCLTGYNLRYVTPVRFALLGSYF